MTNHSWVEVDLAAFDENVQTVRQALRPPTEPVLMVKANAYGHGLGPLVRRAAAGGVTWFAVAHMHEALAAREAAPDARIVLLGAADRSDVPILLDKGIIPIVVGVEHARLLGSEATRRGADLGGHLKIDTGMGRYGLLWDEALAVAGPLLAIRGIRIDGLCTHFARVDTGEPDPAQEQARRFFAVADLYEREAGRRLFKHISNSRAFILHPEWDLDGVRPGIVLYGYGASLAGERIHTRPILQWKARVMQARRVPARFPVGYYGTYVTPAPTTLAVIGLGYADGYLRALSNKGHVLIRGRRCRVVGRVSMNWITVDAGPYADVQQGDEVVLIGCQGNQEIWADELAVLCRTIPYEILTGIGASIERRYCAE